MSEQTLLCFWDSFINELVSITNELEQIITQNNPKYKELLIQNYNKFPKLLNEKLLTDFENIYNKVNNEKKIDSEITKRVQQVENVLSCSELNPVDFSNIVYDLSDAKELVERLTKEIIAEKNKNNHIFNLQSQINANKLKLRNILNNEIKEAITKQIARDEETLETLTRSESKYISSLEDEIANLKNKITEINNCNKEKEETNSIKLHVSVVEEGERGSSQDEMQKLVEEINSLKTENESLKTSIQNNTTIDKEELKGKVLNLESQLKEHLKFIDQLNNTHSVNTKIIDNFDMINLEKFRDSVAKKVENVKLISTIENIHKALAAKKNADARRICTKAMSNEFNVHKEVSELVNELTSMMNSFKDMKDIITSRNESIQNQMHALVNTSMP